MAFEGIALTMSGGGYRAAAFHLGTLQMLERLGLRNRLRALSTISGGTIVGAAYVRSLVREQPFPEFVEEFKRFLSSTNVITKSLENLDETRVANGADVMPSLIRSAANVYANEHFGEMRFAEVLDSKIPISEISFNTTEFKTGRAFRFQTGLSRHIYSGNQDLKVKYESQTNRSVRIADIVAASSCFPSGFEPMRFPSDFVWTEDHDLGAVRRELGKHVEKEIPLMDGGIFDNQGVDSIINIVKERQNQEFDLLIVSDSDPKKSDFFEFPVKPRAGWLTLQQTYLIVQLIIVLAAGSAIAIAVNLIMEYNAPTLSWPAIFFLNIIPLSFSLAVFSIILWARSLVADAILNIESKTEIPIRNSFRGVKIWEAVHFAGSRIGSLVVMSGSVFMKRIRDLGYERIYSDRYLNSIALSTLIYGLDEDIKFQGKWSGLIEKADLQPSKELRSVAKKARQYSTNLWFLTDDQTNLDNLIKCGEATLCYELLTFLLTQHLPALSKPESAVARLFQNVKSTWKEMNEPSEVENKNEL
ncbi:MAG: patatin-like phospholipase family protein [Acidobacteriota bacterium]|nr:MAG: patatin-like phospholipase family protein [Acidobacteriota bacterium]